MFCSLWNRAKSSLCEVVAKVQQSSCSKNRDPTAYHMDSVKWINELAETCAPCQEHILWDTNANGEISASLRKQCPLYCDIPHTQERIGKQKVMGAWFENIFWNEFSSSEFGRKRSCDRRPIRGPKPPLSKDANMPATLVQMWSIVSNFINTLSNEILNPLVRSWKY